MACMFAIVQSALMTVVAPVMGERSDRASASYVAANLFKGGVLCAMVAQRHNWDMAFDIVARGVAPDASVVLWNAMVYASLDLSALVVNGAMQWRTVMHHVFVVAVATCIAELGPEAAVAQAATLYAFWSGVAACVNLVMAASKVAQVRGERLPSTLFAMALGVYAFAFACNIATVATIVARALAENGLPAHHALPGAAIVAVWAYDDAALMRWLAKMAAPEPKIVSDAYDSE